MKQRTLVRSIAIGAVAVASIALTGCTMAPESALEPSECVPAAQPGPATEAVSTNGAFGSLVDASYVAPLKVDSLQISRDGQGSGEVITEHGVAEANFTVLSAESGLELLPYQPLAPGFSGTGGPASMVSVGDALPGLIDVFQCARAGERVIAAMSLAQLVGEDAQATFANPGETLIVVADVLRVYRSGASGLILPPVDGIPAVVTAPSGQPGVTMPKTEAPTELRIATRVQGYGQVIEAGQMLTLQYSVFDWDSGSMLASTWTTDQNVMQTFAGGVAGVDNLYGMTRYFVGETVGSQFVIVVPTDIVVQNVGPLAPVASANRTLVFVVDVLAADS